MKKSMNDALGHLFAKTLQAELCYEDILRILRKCK